MVVCGVGVGMPRARSSRRDPLLLVGVGVPLFPTGSRRGAVADVLLLLRRRIDGASMAPPALKLALPAMPPTRLTSASATALVDGVVGVVADRPSAKAVKVALHVLYRLYPWSQNRVKAVDAGAVSALARLRARRRGDDHICGYAEGRIVLVAHPTGLAAVACAATRLSAAGTESAVRTLHAMARHSATPAVLQEVQAGVRSLFDAAESAFGAGAPHIVVANAAVLDDKYPTLVDTATADFDRTFAVNTRGAFLCLREAAHRLPRGGGGRIVAITSSVVGSHPTGYSAYTASKAAVEAMVRTMAKELKGTRITANCVAPGATATDMFFAGKSEERVDEIKATNPMGRLGEAGDIAPVVGFLCTDAAEWVNGQVIRVNGGYV
uniref:Uncharacterized protein n=1 Tax=Oryza nivara TaxID=4536 RepID=A0A0E0I2C1_ORYNI